MRIVCCEEKQRVKDVRELILDTEMQTREKDRCMLREALNRAGHALRAHEQVRIDLDAFAEAFFAKDLCKAAFFLTEALMQGAYHFAKEALRRCTEENLYALRDELAVRPDAEVFLVTGAEGEKAEEIKEAVRRGQCLGRCRGYARMLGDLPSNYLTMNGFLHYAERMTAEHGIGLTVYRDRALKEMGCGGILAVNQASDKEAALLHIRYQGNPCGRRVAVVGKGVLFDSGGMHLKSMRDMDGMKYDMCGAADALCLVEYAATVKSPCSLDAVIPVVENLAGQDAVRMGDVITTLSGKTVEIYNTDAEGRLILADALAFACGLDEKVDLLFDLATLTYSCQSALGDETAGYFCREKELAEAVEVIAEDCGEPVWRLPLGERYRRRLLWTKTADIANYVPDKSAGASLAACFLEEFVDEVPWVHFDMVGPAVQRGESGRMESGATGTLFATAAALLYSKGIKGVGLG